MQTIGDNIARIRKQRTITQEHLAEAAGLSVETIRKLERNERTAARMSTLNKIARVLGVATSTLLGNVARGAANREPDSIPLGLVDMRRALTPVRGLGGQLVEAGPEQTAPALDDVRDAILTANRMYHANDYTNTLMVLPGLLGEARMLVDITDGDERLTAHILAARAHQLAGRLMIQMRQVDLAHAALTLALDHADQSGDELTGAAAIGPMCWLLLRQGRLGETEQLAISTADRIEPRMSRARPAEVALWGEMYVRAAAAAVRDNRDNDADQMLDLAATAAQRLGDETDEVIATGGIDLSTGSVAMMRVEAAVIAGRPDRALTLSTGIERSPQVTPSSRQRHRLDVASSYAQTGQYAEATGVLLEIREQAPAWIRQQRYARDIVESIRDVRRRAMTQEMADLAKLVGVDV
ncbi:helix-turn-helix protein [Micromonospora pisi]|uniref:Helix-turn-helix protein n=1 Tax=Micromonospora pisi TaxID=589240 RepID=A0A495JUR8_9ACTN|nr:helix-turn-helix transcriptional regulator [Micromonospora pisi]RKR92740.1 helix-turn-helix protein [Micromonospora pisi]